MKSTVKILIVISSLLAACQIKSAKNQAFIDGIYVNHTQGDYAIADDTLTATHTDANHYLITRNTGYQAIRNGKLLSKKHKAEKLQGTYDDTSQILNETTTGRIFRFDPAKRLLLIKQAVYHKLN